MAKLTIPIVVDWDGIKDRIKNGDLVEVVRCKDCVYGFGRCTKQLWVQESDGFCSRGERREDVEIHK